jgi:hypothetical protein
METCIGERTTRREDTLTMVFALWTLIGLLVDAYFHSTDPGLETFWTPWHALFYSGFTATAIWLVWITAKRSRPGGHALEWAPAGYAPALAGIGVFAIGGMGDAVWHSIFGVETSLDALLSPTHLLLFVGLLLIVSAPLRAAMSDVRRAGVDRPGIRPEPGLHTFAPALASLIITTTVVAFFFQYAWAITETWMVRVPYDPDQGTSELVAALAVVGVIVTTIISFTPLLVASRYWKLPFGAGTILLTAVNVFIALGFDGDLTTVPAAIVAGVAFDVLAQVRGDRRHLAAIPPAIMWTLHFAIVGHTGRGLGLAPEIWGGAIVFAILASVTIDLIMQLAERAPLPGPAPRPG